MAVSNVLLLSQATGYIVALILSLCTVVPLVFHLKCFNGHCLLFTTGRFADDGNFLPVWGSKAYCIYTTVVGSVLLVVSLVQSARMLTMLWQGVDSSFLSAFLDCVITLVMTIAVLVASIFVTMGFKTWCEAVMQRFAACDEASVMEIDKADKITTKGFYIQIGTVQFGAWSSWVSWVFLTVLSMLKLCRYHEREVIRVSMARQRQKIIGHCDQDLLCD